MKKPRLPLLALAALASSWLGGCTALDNTTPQWLRSADDHAVHAIGYLGRPLPDMMRSGSFGDDPAVRGRLRELCMRDAGLHLVQKIRLPATEPVTFRRSPVVVGQYADVSEPVGTFNGRYELWQSFRHEKVGDAWIRRMESTVLDAYLDKPVATAVNYRATGADKVLRDTDPHCGDDTLAGLARAVFDRGL